LRIAGGGSGAGIVVGTGIECSYRAGGSSGDCAQGFGQNTQVALTARPASGSKFAGWSGGGCSGTGACVVVMDQSKTVTATFLGG
jgi:hypothetical protein